MQSYGILEQPQVWILGAVGIGPPNLINGQAISDVYQKTTISLKGL
jgi:hypothetical protein